MIAVGGGQNMYDLTIEDFDLLTDEEFERFELIEAD